MPTTTPIENKVAKSGLITLDLAKYLDEDKKSLIDLKDFLFKGLILKEKEFRATLKEMDWSQYEGKLVGVYCSNNAIIPQWAYMLMASYLTGVASDIVFGDEKALQIAWVNNSLSQINIDELSDRRVIIKGCGDKSVPAAAYGEITKRLLPVAKTIMYGEPCSTVPIYKKPKK